MQDNLPLLFFPEAKSIPPRKRNRGWGSPDFQRPDHKKQSQRLHTQIEKLHSEFAQYKATVSNYIGGLEPETVLVIEIAGSVSDFQRAVDHTDGLEWIAEYEIDGSITLTAWNDISASSKN